MPRDYILTIGNQQKSIYFLEIHSYIKKYTHPPPPHKVTRTNLNLHNLRMFPHKLQLFKAIGFWLKKILYIFLCKNETPQSLLLHHTNEDNERINLESSPPDGASTQITAFLENLFSRKFLKDSSYIYNVKIDLPTIPEELYFEVDLVTSN